MTRDDDAFQAVIQAENSVAYLRNRKTRTLTRDSMEEIVEDALKNRRDDFIVALCLMFEGIADEWRASLAMRKPYCGGTVHPKGTAERGLWMMSLLLTGEDIPEARLEGDLEPEETT